ncbi:MAG: ubiquitin-conjugating enzyme E2 [Planctomycetota bacterium]
MVQEDSPRIRRLKAEYQKMVELSARSDFIRFHVQDQAPGRPPEKYLITFTCKGYSSIDSSKMPILSELHQVLIYLDMNYPKAPPKMRWQTPIWQPNIQHTEPFKVCIDPAWWAASRTLDRLVTMLGEMVQYKNYHAENTPPFPMDKEVAEWVRTFAEPRGLLSKTKPVDSRELCRPQRIKKVADESEQPSQETLVQEPASKVKLTPKSETKPRIQILKEEDKQKPNIKIY